MTRILTMAAAWFLLGAAGLAPKGAPAVAPPAHPLNYVAHWRLLTAAHASLDWSAAPGGFHRVRFTADALGVVNLLYPVRDRWDTVYDPDGFCATDVHKQTLEGRRQRDTHIVYEASQHQLVLDETDPTQHPPAVKHEVKPIPGCVLNLFSALDYVRSQPLQLGDTYNFPVNEGGDTAEVRMTADLRETVVTPAGIFHTIRTTPDVFNNSVFKRKGQMWIWFSDDARHLPVQIVAKVSWGTITVQLEDGAKP